MDFTSIVKPLPMEVPHTHHCADEYLVFTGADMNAEYGLTGNNAYPDDQHFLCFPLHGLDIPRLTVFKLIAEDRWFDDIVDNNRRREEEK